MNDLHHVVTRWHMEFLRDRAARAALRRAQSTEEVWTIPAFLALYRRVCALDPPHDRPLVLARTALVVAEVPPPEAESAVPSKPAHELRPGRVFGRPREGGAPAVSFERLRKLAETEDPDLFVRLLRAALGQAEGEGHPLHLSRLVHDWHFPASRLRARRQLLLDYATVAPEHVFTAKEGTAP